MSFVSVMKLDCLPENRGRRVRFGVSSLPFLVCIFAGSIIDMAANYFAGKSQSFSCHFSPADNDRFCGAGGRGSYLNASLA